MGYMKHHSIAVSSWNRESIEEAHRIALSIFFENQVTGIARTTINTDYFFFVGPTVRRKVGTHLTPETPCERSSSPP